MLIEDRTWDVEAVVSLVSTEDGGRKKPVASGYRPAHLVRDDYLTTGSIEFLNCEWLFPGESAEARIVFTDPSKYPGCLWIGRNIEMQEGKRVIGHARITRILNKLLEGNG